MLQSIKKMFRKPMKITILNYVVIAVFMVSLTSMILYIPITNQGQKVDKRNSLNNKNIPSSSLKIQSISNRQTNHGIITIVSNSGFSTCGCATGSGTRSDPYIIQNYVIGSNSASNPSSSGSGLSIKNTNVYFIIKSVTVENILGGSGFLLSNVTNGNLTDDIATSNFNNGFDIQSSSNISFTNSQTTFNNANGVIVSKSSQFITLNNISSRDNAGDGFLIDSSSNIAVLGSLATSNSKNGFELEFSPGNNLTSDTAINNLNYAFYYWNSPNLKTANNLSQGNKFGAMFSESRSILGYKLSNTFAGSAYNILLFFVVVVPLVVLILGFVIIFLIYRRMKGSSNH